ncbi:hypothetical protein BBBOND_0300070 [Babesia bigemina]|uniref:Uncharacterized protein n=1 Tax=Babesia bigemina TaxID=5866 RepID=A0A061D7X5_BABBI|nr:hypothetical protein BBBOND_0300070 [Babesia bigemina]CDR96102.1 hypothetical protein BBBOND_0300070 [Babesia bigemina]|eukprot:XP_012768288.1 hypothetical protein BBBOND_0300070 [Babesia bigemina]
MRGLAAAVVEGTGSGSGSCCSWLRGVERQWLRGLLRGLGAAVVEGSGAAVVEGTGRGREDDDRGSVYDPEASLALSSPPEDESQENNSNFFPNPQAIAAVIVGIIVAIILLDLCIFRFPVGRNIRDFLVRKIPFCIAFYS